MLIILLIIGISLIVLGCLGVYARGCKISYDFGCVLNVIGGILTPTVVIVMIFAITFSVKIPQIEEKLTIYSEENARIESQVKTAIETYQNYEQGIFEDIDLDKISSEKLLLLTSIYPELKSDTMVQRLIQIYIDNTNAIKEIRTKKLDYEVWRWWLCFR